MAEEADLETKVEAWRLATQENLPQREIARRLGIAPSSVHKYIQEGRTAEVYAAALAVAEMRTDVAFRLQWLIRRWTSRLEQSGIVPELKEELAISKHLAELLAQFATLMGLNEPTRVAVSQDGPERRVPDPQMVAAIEAAQKDNRAYLARIQAGLPAHEEEESA